LDASSIDAIIQSVYQHYRVGSDPEITLEANPDDITKSKAAEWKSMGINRFSIGIQSFSNKHLQWMNRAHNGLQSIACIATIRNAGFENFSIDLIYGTPGQSIHDWEKDVEQAIGLQIPHLSCYALTVEQETPLFHLIKKGEKENTNSDLQAEEFQLLVTKTRSAGYRHYEISNFALPGMESKHNSSYWSGNPYLGFGPSAHSFHDHTRNWNISNNIEYIRSIEKNERSFESEQLSEKDMFNEYIMTHLRLDEGISSNWIKDNWGIDQLHQIEHMALRHITSGHVIKTTDGWKLTDQGKFLADGIAADLFQV
jgi:oxygen-independent coproporphyrinogen-3 oxidase